jgi:hypothetical protein
MERTLVLIDEPAAGHPILVDLYRCAADQPHRYDWVLHHLGRAGAPNATVQPASGPLGPANGYQHIALRGRAALPDGLVRYTWWDADAAATLVLAAPPGATLILGQLGANDPNGDLRPEAVLVVRADGQADALFAAVVDPHGAGEPAMTGIAIVASGPAATTIELSGRGWRKKLAVGHGRERRWGWSA